MERLYKASPMLISYFISYFIFSILDKKFNFTTVLRRKFNLNTLIKERLFYITILVVVILGFGILAVVFDIPLILYGSLSGISLGLLIFNVVKTQQKINRKC